MEKERRKFGRNFAGVFIILLSFAAMPLDYDSLLQEIDVNGEKLKYYSIPGLNDSRIGS